MGGVILILLAVNCQLYTERGQLLVLCVTGVVETDCLFLLGLRQDVRYIQSSVRVLLVVAVSCHMAWVGFLLHAMPNQLRNRTLMCVSMGVSNLAREFDEDGVQQQHK